MWFERRTLRGGLSARELLARKGAARISLVLPARNEEGTVGAIVGAALAALVDRVPLLDEVVVMDHGSTDATAQVARRAGAAVVAVEGVLPAHGTRQGKGEVLWTSLHATSGDLLVYCDADVSDFRADFVTGLLTPLLTEPGVSLVKACYDRPLRHADGALEPTGGGRVTELVARPLLDLMWPVLSGVVQPLAGEFAARRELLERLPFASGYAVDIALLVDAVEAVGLDGLAQVDLGTRTHRHQPVSALGRMSAAIIATALARQGREPAASALTQFVRDGAGGFAALTHPLHLGERPPMVTVPEYAARRAQAC